MKMTSSQFFINVKRFLQHTLLLVFSCTLATGVLADVGETHELKQKRSELQKQLSALRNDTTGSDEQVAEVTAQLIRIDEQIFESYDETIERLEANRSEKASNGQLLVWLALATTIIAIFFAFLLAMARGRILNSDGFGLMDLYRQLTLDFFGKVSPEKANSTKALRVNIVVVVGLLFMGFSIIAYLLTKF